MTTLAISPDGKSIAAGDEQGDIHLWDRPEENIEPVTQPAAANWSAHGEAIRSLAYIRIGDKLALVSGGDDGVLKRWDTASRTVIGPDMADHAEPVRSIAVSPDGKVLAAGSSNGTLRLWDAATGTPVRRFEKPKDAEENYELYTVGFSRDGKHLAVGSYLQVLRVLDLEKPDSDHILQGHADAIKSLSWGRAGWLLSAGQDGRVLEWQQKALTRPQAKGLRKRDEFEFLMESQERKPLTSMDTSANGGLILTGGDEGHVQLWDGVERVLIGPQFLGHANADIRAVALVPDGSFFVTADASTILVWPGPDRWADIICSKLDQNMSVSNGASCCQTFHMCDQCPNLPIAPDDPVSGAK